MGAPFGNKNAKGKHKTSSKPKKIDWEKLKKSAQRKHPQAFYEKRIDRLEKSRERYLKNKNK